MKQTMMKVLDQMHLLQPARTAKRSLWLAQRKLLRTDEKIIGSYIASEKTRKLQIGSGSHLHEGWLNSEYYPWMPNILHLDATKTFPLSSDSFDYIYSEHIIEHLPFLSGQSMLSECYRVLKPQGRIRVATPSLAFLVELYTNPSSELSEAYISWATSLFVSYAPEPSPVFAINNFFRDFGHQFIYDEETLRSAFRVAGFEECILCQLNESSDAELRNLENVDRMPPDFLAFETIILEAIKPKIA